MACTQRITAFRNGLSTEGCLLQLAGTLEQLLQTAGSKLGLPEAKKFYTSLGAIIDCVDLLRDDDILYVSCGEPFLPPAVAAKAPGAGGDDKIVSCSTHLVPPFMPRVATDQEWVTLNVGGRYFTTTRSTLTNREPESMLASMFSTEPAHSWRSRVDPNGAYLVDRSSTYFEPILNYLRHGCVILDGSVEPRGVLEEARFFGLQSLVDILKSRIADSEAREPTDCSPITRREVVLRLMSTPSNCELRCQGVNFTGVNLSKLDLRYINFKYSIFQGANLSGSNLSCCNFERADMSTARLDGANLLGVKMPCVNLEGASMQGCNFEDPAGCRANLEGANLKHVQMEGSHMAGTNLRVATLKNAQLRNCDLRGAVLAGADLENCDMTGCDLQEANLRGANLKGASLELMVNPLHMSQAVR